VQLYWLRYDGILHCLDDEVDIPEERRHQLINKVAKALINSTSPETIARTKRRVLEKHRKMVEELWQREA